MQKTIINNKQQLQETKVKRAKLAEEKSKFEQALDILDKKLTKSKNE